MATYTVRIVSHKCDRMARKKLVGQFSEKTGVAYCNDLARSVSTFEIETIVGGKLRVSTVKVIDCDYDPECVQPADAQNIVFIDSGAGSASGKLVWMEHVAGDNTDRWDHSWDANGFSCLIINGRHLTNVTCRADYEYAWTRFLERKFDIRKPILTTISMFDVPCAAGCGSS